MRKLLLPGSLREPGRRCVLLGAAAAVWGSNGRGFVVSFFLGQLVTSTTKSLPTFRRGKKYWPTYIFVSSFLTDKQ